MSNTSHVVEDGHEQDIIVPRGQQGCLEFREHECSILEARLEVGILKRLAHKISLLFGSLLSVLKQLFLLVDHQYNKLSSQTVGLDIHNYLIAYRNIQGRHT